MLKHAKLSRVRGVRRQHGSGPLAVINRNFMLKLDARSKSSNEISIGGDGNPSYDAKSITVLTGLEPVRVRPGMYIGNTGSRGLHQLIYEVIDNSVDEALAGHCSEISVVLNFDGSVTVTDNGRGIPCDMHPHSGKSSLETVLCVLHAGGKFGGESSGYRVSGGLHGVGVSVVNALSSSLSVSVYRDGFNHSMSFVRGKVASELAKVPLTDAASVRGTAITFTPDAEIFKVERTFDEKLLAKRFDELAYLNPGLKFTFIDQRQQGKSLTKEPQIFQHNGGISELLADLCKNQQSLHPKVPILTVKQMLRGISVEACLQWGAAGTDAGSAPEHILTFANNIHTHDGGTHLDGLRAAIAKTVNQFAKKVRKCVIIGACVV